MADTFTMETTVVASGKQISSNLAGEEVILQLESGVYYGLEGVGAFIWEQVKEPKTIGQLCAAVSAEFDVEAAQCQHDTLAFLSNLLDAQLLETR